MASGIIERRRWEAAPANPARLDRNDGVWRYVTVHHSAEPNPPRLSGTLEDSAAAVRRIQSAHVKGEGNGDIGYHYLIDPFGRIFEGRPLTYQGAHARGSNNVRNLGVCLLGHFEQEAPTSEALESLRVLLDWLREVHSIPKSQVFVHDDFVVTVCPGRRLRGWVRSYAR